MLVQGTTPDYPFSRVLSPHSLSIDKEQTPRDASLWSSGGPDPEPEVTGWIRAMSIGNIHD